MSVLGIICEYNPFHSGHKYHIEKSKEITGSNYVVAVMSGSFVQRGEPAFMDKWSRANMALENGIDLVIELPFIYASQRAESFADGAIRLLNGLNIVDHICFGSESNDLPLLQKIAEILANPNKEFMFILNKFLSENFSYPVARSKALEIYFDDNLGNILNSSNNILAIEYLKAMKISNSKIKPNILLRQGAAYNSLDISHDFMSATGIRNLATQGSFDKIQAHMDRKSTDIMKDFYNEFDDFNSLEKYEEFIFFKLRFEKPEDIMDSTQDLLNRLMNNALIYKDLGSLIDNTISKTYTKSRIKRVLVHILFNLKKNTFVQIDEIYPSYIRVLGANDEGLKLLRSIKEKSSLPIINKFSSYHKLRNENIDKIIAFDKLATDLFYYPLKNKTYNMDYSISPYIKKNTPK